MPLYEYFCDTCEQFFEELLKKDMPNRKCPVCGRVSHRIISKSNFKIRIFLFKWLFKRTNTKT